MDEEIWGAPTTRFVLFIHSVSPTPSNTKDRFANLLQVYESLDPRKDFGKTSLRAYL
jgi:hypothetical protein